MILDKKNIMVDFNGIVIFSYPAIEKYFEGGIKNGQNILKNFIETDLGDKVIDDGVIIPITNIDDGSYEVNFIEGCIERQNNRRIIFNNPGFILNVENEIYVADAAVFWDWEAYLGWEKINIPIGLYKLTIEGFQNLNKFDEIETIGYDIILEKVISLPKRTAIMRDNNNLY